uniref:Mitochondrial import receptor subunit TOM22 homolog n=1 Tax=Chromera velia CCMP2878 TaxID=1169474 RepID=A0A0G4FX73_9ALVE|eukprot:Cvel_19217.t1-p1 / transcript=Cvel_19217.t1 / gene=Cvel_19217 / organism=Chromera_velia_CCMP2878 / gene_product=hypothetical protein / transcript_product=hypothetical protein / location=Cvel_scaffold1641:27915-30301(+) / protein_length=75 / sequence_SO=supercontig / SO=protein_coding / is_pseudo=false
MGNVLSRSPVAQRAVNRLAKYSSVAWNWGSTALWVVCTSFIVLGVPVFFEYEKECQMFDMQAQMMQAQQNAEPAA